MQLMEELSNGVLNKTEVYMSALKFFIFSHPTFKKRLF